MMKKTTRPGAHAAPAAKADARPKVKKERPARVRRPHTEKRKQRFFLAGTAVALALLALLAALRLYYDRPDTYGESMAAARESREAGDYDSALRFLRKAAAEQETEECLLLMADCYEEQDNLEKALEILRGMDLSRSEVSERIARIDAQRQLLREADSVEVLGNRLPADTTVLVRDGMGLKDEDLREIARLYALDDLSLADNELRDISALSVLGGLDILNLSGNHIEDLSPLASLSELRSLVLDGNPIEDLTPLYGLSGLNALSLKGINLSKTALAELSEALPGCAIHSDADRLDATDIMIGGVTFKSDVTQLNLGGCGIRDISVLSDCRDLRWLRLPDNEINDLQALMNIPALESLDVSGNALTDLRPLMGMTRLRTLNAAGNALTDTAAVGAMSALTSLDLSDNALTDFSGLEKLSNLQILKLKNTGIRDMDLQYLENLHMLKTLSLEDNDNLSNEAMSYLKSMLPYCTILHSDLIYTAYINGDPYPSNQTELDLSGQGLTDLGDIGKLVCLERLDLSQNRLESIYQLEYCPSRQTIRWLDLSGNQLENVDALAAFSAVEEIDLSGNQIRSIQALQRIGTLRRLRVGDNPLTEEQLADFRKAMPNCELITD